MSKELTLYELTAEAKDLANILKSSDADDQAILDTLASVGLDIEEKGESYIAVYRELELFEEAFEKEEKRLANGKKIIRNRKEQLKERLKECAETLGIKKIETKLGTIAIRKNPPSLSIKNEREIPGSYLTIIPQTTEPNKKAILDDLKAGKVVAGCELTQGTHIRIG